MKSLFYFLIGIILTSCSWVALPDDYELKIPSTNKITLPPLWDKSLGGLQDDDFQMLMPTSDGDFVLAGSSKSSTFGTKTTVNYGDYDFWIIKINSNGDRVWDKVFGGTNTDLLTTMIPTHDNGFLLGGTSKSNVYKTVSGVVGKSDNVISGIDYFVVKIDANGNWQWDKTFGGSEEDVLTCLADVQDGYVLGGYTESPKSATKSSENKGGNDFWLIKIDNQGKKVWDKTFGGSKDDKLKAMTVLGDGSMVLAGTSVSNQSGDKTENSRSGFEDYWVVRIDKNQNKIWDKTFGGAGYDFLSSMIKTTDESLLLGGSSFSLKGFDKSVERKGDTGGDYWVIKIATDGTKKWDNVYGGFGNDDLTTLIETGDYGFLVGGASNSWNSGDKSENSFGQEDAWITKVNADGKLIWEKSIGGQQRDILKSMAITRDGGFLLGLTSASSKLNNIKPTATNGGMDYWITKVK